MTSAGPLPGLLTAEQFAESTNGNVSATDPRLQPLIAGATAAVRRYCGWHIAPTIEQTITMDAPGGHFLALPTLALSEVLSLSELGTALSDGVDFEWSTLGSVVRLGRGWPNRYRAITTTIRHGFDDVPDVRQVIQQVVANALASPMGATAESAGGVSVTWAQTAPGVAGGLSLLERDLSTLNLYRLSSWEA